MDEQDQQQQNQIPPQETSPAQRPVQNWDRSPGIKTIGGIIVILAVFAAVVFGLSMCNRAVTPASQTGDLGDGYNILEQRVRQAFGNNGAPSQSTTGTSQSQPSPPAQDQTQTGQGQQTQQQDPQEQQAEQMQQQQEIILQQEEIREQQREQVPSLLPENPPQPATLGEY